MKFLLSPLVIVSLGLLPMAVLTAINWAAVTASGPVETTTTTATGTTAGLTAAASADTAYRVAAALHTTRIEPPELAPPGVAECALAKNLHVALTAEKAFENNKPTAAGIKAALDVLGDPASSHAKAVKAKLLSLKEGAETDDRDRREREQLIAKFNADLQQCRDMLVDDPAGCAAKLDRWKASTDRDIAPARTAMLQRAEFYRREKECDRVAHTKREYGVRGDFQKWYRNNAAHLERPEKDQIAVNDKRVFNLETMEQHNPEIELVENVRALAKKVDAILARTADAPDVRQDAKRRAGAKLAKFSRPLTNPPKGWVAIDQSLKQATVILSGQGGERLIVGFYSRPDEKDNVYVYYPTAKTYIDNDGAGRKRFTTGNVPMNGKITTKDGPVPFVGYTWLRAAAEARAVALNNGDIGPRRKWEELLQAAGDGASAARAFQAGDAHPDVPLDDLVKELDRLKEFADTVLEHEVWSAFERLFHP